LPRSLLLLQLFLLLYRSDAGLNIGSVLQVLAVELNGVRHELIL